MNVACLVPSSDRPAQLDSCLEGILSQAALPAEVFVATKPDDSATHRVIDMWTRNADVPVRPTYIVGRGFIAPIREGVRAVTSDVVAIVDDDATPEPGWLATLVEPLRDPRIACVGGRVVERRFRGRVDDDAGAVRWYGKFVGNVGARETDGIVDVGGVMEGNWAWRTSVLRGLDFDPVFDLDDGLNYGLDLCLQAKRLGYRVVYTSAARVRHEPGPRSDAVQRGRRARMAFVAGRNRTYLALKHYEPWRLAAFLPWWFLVGERQTYGLAKGLVDLVLGRPQTAAAMRASLAGRKAGFQWWLDHGRARVGRTGG